MTSIKMKLKNKKRSRLNRILNGVFVVGVLIGLVLFFNKEIRNSLIAINSNQYQLSHVTAQQIKKNKETKAKVSYDFTTIQPVTFSSVVGAQLSKQQLPVIGGIAIPDLKINLPIFLGVSNTSLLYGAGTMKANQTMGQGNYALVSHHVFGFYNNYSQLLFSPLQNAKAGMSIYITDKTTVYTYQIAAIFTVDKSDVSVIDDVPDKKIITLVTCETLGGPRREIVQGTLAKSYSFEKAPAAVQQSFGMAYNQIQG